MKKLIAAFLFLLLNNFSFSQSKMDSSYCDCHSQIGIEANFFQFISLAPNLGASFFPHKNFGIFVKTEYDFNSLGYLIPTRPYNVNSSSIKGFRFSVGLVTKIKLNKNWRWKNYFLLTQAQMQRKDDVQIANYYGVYKTTINFTNTYQLFEWHSCFEIFLSPKTAFQAGLGYNIILASLSNDYNYAAYPSRGSVIKFVPNNEPFASTKPFEISGIMLLLKLNYFLEK